MSITGLSVAQAQDLSVRETAALCLRAAKEAAHETGVPLQLLQALTLTETGRRGEAGLQPWPWTLNLAGEGQWFATQSDALTALSEAIAAGQTNVDIGCFQLNYHWHSAAFSSLEDMLDPQRNAHYAAKFVARHAVEQGDWVAAAGAFHSATPERAEIYLARFEPIYAALGSAGASAGLRDETRRTRNNRFPLLLAGSAGSPGSVVPLRPGGQALIGGP
ncbi:lytic transglycosylase domain-containing protein [Xinfangfangia sp. CPCC 101601]|uniref:Lytic transglycosylase domain-containing protein n=1 Tax=Pseudogemmobacter lacusdianii TaxID=3069608 RepID=A0ABU0VU84_9RHOB|nr:lytic transglycosylase domain-containing protein [Xinfangfangia sp. CPCC 101601]MDQ2065289.1 lytic transglycosylase domain-containing protein [Xinfangfangia sp. CPCC 101601]